MLKERKLSFRSTDAWDDCEDKEALEIYKHYIGAKSLLALCFTGVSETFHHWRIYASGKNGCCITFDWKKLIDCIPDNACSEEIEYLTQNDIRMRRHKIKPSELPFIKRASYRDEKEYRIIYPKMDRSAKSVFIKIDLSAIKRITLSPWMPTQTFIACKEEIANIKGCGHIEVCCSRLLKNDRWANYIKEHLGS